MSYSECSQFSLVHFGKKTVVIRLRVRRMDESPVFVSCRLDSLGGDVDDGTTSSTIFSLRSVKNQPSLATRMGRDFPVRIGAVRAPGRCDDGPTGSSHRLVMVEEF